MVTPIPDDEFDDAYNGVRAMLGLGPWDPFASSE